MGGGGDILPAKILGKLNCYIGLVLGVISGYLGTKVDIVIMRLTDMTLSLPTIRVAIFLAMIIGASARTVIIAVAAVLCDRFARVIQGEVLSLRERDFIAQAKINVE